CCLRERKEFRAAIPARGSSDCAPQPESEAGQRESCPVRRGRQWRVRLRPPACRAPCAGTSRGGGTRGRPRSGAEPVSTGVRSSVRRGRGCGEIASFSAALLGRVHQSSDPRLRAQRIQPGTELPIDLLLDQELPYLSSCFGETGCLTGGELRNDLLFVVSL